jgi:hypothetical protein
MRNSAEEQEFDIASVVIANSASEVAGSNVVDMGRFCLGRKSMLVAGAAGAILLSELDSGCLKAANAAPVQLDESPVFMPEVSSDLPKDNFTKVPEMTKLPVDRFLALIAMQEHWKTVSEQALSKFVATDPEVAKLLKFMQERAFYSVPQGPVQTVVMIAPGDEAVREKMEDGFEIVFMPEEYAAGMKAPILTQNQGRTMRIATSFKSQEWLGIMLAHEMSHVHAGIVEGENFHNRGQYLEGEVNAHLLEMKLLKSWDEEAYGRLISGGIPLWNKRDKAGLIALSESLYPLTDDLVSSRESGLGMASCIIAVAFESARKYGATPIELGHVYQELGRFFAGN